MADKLLIDTEELVAWTYQRQKADLVYTAGIGLYEQERTAEGLEPRGVSGDGCYQVARNAELGGRIHFSGASAALHPDAEIVHETVTTLPHLPRFLLIEHGKTGRRPDWLPGVRPQMGPVLRANGKLMMLYNDYGHGIACRVRDVVSMCHIQHARSVYAAWWQALHALHARLDAHREMLSRYRAMPPAAPSSPWIDA